jgi:hypothetical protein
MPLKDKTASTLTIVMKNIFYKSNRTPLQLQTDRGSEFVNAQMKQLMRSKRVQIYTSQNENQSCFCVMTAAHVQEQDIRYFTDRNTLQYSDDCTYTEGEEQTSSRGHIRLTALQDNTIGPVTVLSLRWIYLVYHQLKPV